jgi:methionine sulfoxide reductase heme-binding subunit
MEPTNSERWLRRATYAMLGLHSLAVLLVFVVGDLGAAYLGLPTPASWLASLANTLFAAGSVQALWYVTRAAGLTAYLLLWFSTAWGLLVSTRILDGFLGRVYTYDFHQFTSLLAIGFTFAHVVVLLGDRYLPFSMAQILIPFASTYRPLWVGVGTIALYLTLLVTVTFYLRRQIGVEAFRAIHVLSLVAYLGATVHGLLAGTDSVLPSAQLMYFSTFFVVVFLFLLWLGHYNAARSPLPGALTPSPVPSTRPTGR